MNPLNLTPDERASMKAEMSTFMRAHPLPKRRPLISPFAHLFRIAVPAMAVVLVFSGSALAAEQSLPDDFLYPVKLQVIEPLIFNTLSFTPSSKARANSELASRRYDEAETLIAQNELQPDQALELQARIAEHTSAAQSYIKETAASGDVLEALDLGSDLETMLDAHSEIISALADDFPSSSADELSENAADQSEVVEDLGDALQENISTESPDDRAAFARDAAEQAASALSTLTEELAISDRNEEIVMSASDLFNQASSSYSVGATKMTGGLFSDAIPDLQDALAFANQALLMLDSYQEAQ